jgi:hypothetical protein
MVGDAFVIVRYGYEEALDGSLALHDYAAVLVYRDSTPEQRKADRRLRIVGERVELNVGKHRISDIRGTHKLYVIQGDDLQVHDVPCSEGMIRSLLHSRADRIDAYISEAVEVAKATREHRGGV